MNHKKAECILPKDLLDEVQKYIQGEYLYIPKADGSRKKWGEKSGARQELVQRNQSIRYEFSQGKSIDQLAEEYYLAINSIKKIVYSKK
ncbi:CD3324 family protein [Clostridium sediminicola]|uniref:CD3324 family protein n=1 Tax=Clostridium sediminicola TaxID=3114879 RepID=UPI0031F2415E